MISVIAVGIVLISASLLMYGRIGAMNQEMKTTRDALYVATLERDKLALERQLGRLQREVNLVVSEISWFVGHPSIYPMADSLLPKDHFFRKLTNAQNRPLPSTPDK